MKVFAGRSAMPITLMPVWLTTEPITSYGLPKAHGDDTEYLSAGVFQPRAEVQRRPDRV
jgi:hypothetical protein